MSASPVESINGGRLNSGMCMHIDEAWANEPARGINGAISVQVLLLGLLNDLRYVITLNNHVCIFKDIVFLSVKGYDMSISDSRLHLFTSQIRLYEISTVSYCSSLGQNGTYRDLCPLRSSHITKNNPKIRLSNSAQDEAGESRISNIHQARLLVVIRGLNASFRPSPRTLNPKIQIMIASPGKNATCGATWRSARPSLTNAPHSGVGG